MADADANLPSDDDFAIPERQVINAGLNAAIAGIDQLRHYEHVRKPGRKEKKKRGPKARTVSNKYYLLPEASLIPSFKNGASELTKLHHQRGYGFPVGYRGDNECGVCVTFSLDLTEEEYKGKIRNLYPAVLGDLNFSQFKLDRQRKLVELQPTSPRAMSADGTSKNRFRGIVFLKAIETTAQGNATPGNPTSSRDTATGEQAQPRSNDNTVRSENATPANPTTSRDTATGEQAQPRSNNNTVRSENATPANPTTSRDTATGEQAQPRSNDNTVRSGNGTPANPTTSRDTGTGEQAQPRSNDNTVRSENGTPANPTTSRDTATGEQAQPRSNDNTVRSGNGTPGNPTTSRDTATGEQAQPRSNDNTVRSRVTATSNTPASSRNEETEWEEQQSMLQGVFEPTISDSPGQEDEQSPVELRQMRRTQPSGRDVLVMDQDLEFHTSLTNDQRKDEEKRARRAKREKYKQERERKKTECGDEPEGPDAVCVTFRMPAPYDNVKRNFLEEDPIEKLFLFVESSTNIRSCVLTSYPNKELQRGTRAIKDIVRAKACSFNVKQEEQSDIDSSDDEDDDEDMPQRKRQKKIIKDLHQLEERRKQEHEFLCPVVAIEVDRSDIITSVMNAYQNNKNLQYHNLHVTFKDEPGADDSGLTREMFWLFFDCFSKKHMEGYMQKVPNNDHRYQGSDLYETLGRIITHGYVLVGYWPPQLAKASAVAALTCSASGNLVLESFLEVVSEEECRIMKLLLKDFQNAPQEYAMSVLSSYDFRAMVTKETIHEHLTSLALAVTVTRPYYSIMELGKGLRFFQDLFTGITEEVVMELLGSQVPTHEAVLTAMKAYYLDAEDPLRFQEERVFMHLEATVRRLTKAELVQLLKFWTASDVLMGLELKVNFNSATGLKLRPTSNTCSCILHMSRNYTSQADVEKDLKIVISEDPKFDTI